METFFVLLLVMGLLIAASFLGNRSGGKRARGGLKDSGPRVEGPASDLHYSAPFPQANGDPSQAYAGTPQAHAAPSMHVAHEHHTARTPPAHHHDTPAPFEAPPVTHTHIDTGSMGHHHGG